MFQYPYGDEQQLNLNWIINEIIQLHKQLDPDYNEPAFSQIYPYSNTAQLNLDWILAELKTLKGLAPVEPPTEEIDEIGQALLAGAYDPETEYQKNDYIIQDGTAYRATEATTGTFDQTKWREVQIADDLAIITRWADATNTYLNALAASQIANDSDVTGTTVKDALNALLHAVPALTTDNVANESDVPGETSTAALNALLGSLTSVQGQITANVETSTTASKAYAVGEYLVLNGALYRVTAAIANGATITPNTNVVATSVTNYLKDTGTVVLEYDSNFKPYNDLNSNKFRYRKIGNVVTVYGTATPTATLQHQTDGYRLVTLPTEIRPITQLKIICPGSGMNKWLFTINPGGGAVVSRYGIDTDTDLTPGIWLPYSATYIAN